MCFVTTSRHIVSFISQHEGNKDKLEESSGESLTINIPMSLANFQERASPEENKRDMKCCH